MSSSESFGSAIDKNSEEADVSNKESTDDEPLAKKYPSKSKSLKKKSKKDAKKETKNKKVGKKETKNKKSMSSRVECELVAAESEDESEEVYEVEAIVGHREYNGRLVYKIRWKNYEPIHDTWEEYSSLSCPDLLEMYNLKHNVQVRSSHHIKKRKTTSKRGLATKAKKRKNSAEEDSGDESDDVPYDEGSDAEYEVERIVEMRTKKDGTREFLVHWKRWSSDHDTWEPEEHLNCADLIEKFTQRVEEAKNSTVKELRQVRKHTDRFTLSTNDSGRRLSKRNRQKQRVAYFDAEGDED